MFHMVNPSGNVHQYVNTEKKRDERLAAGWKLVEDETPAEEPQQGEEKPKKGKTKKNAAEE